MIQTSTPASGSVNQVQNESLEGLSEEDESFYNSVRDGLNRLARQPRAETIEAILKYSKSL